MTNIRSSTDYGINDERYASAVQPGGLFDDSNFNIGGSSLLAWALDLRPSKDIFWTHRPSNCHGNHTANPQTCGRWGEQTNPGSNCELNAIVATLSTGPVSIADKAGDTNTTLVRRCVAADGRILQPDKPATAVDSMFSQGVGPQTAPPGPVWATSTSFARSGGAVSPLVWHYLLSVDVSSPWNVSGRDLYPMIPTGADDEEGMPKGMPEGWVAHQWFTGHMPTPCIGGSRALASGCVMARVKSARDLPPIHNTRPIMIENDTRTKGTAFLLCFHCLPSRRLCLTLRSSAGTFDLTELAPVVNGWVLLGEVGRCVPPEPQANTPAWVFLQELRADLWFLQVRSGKQGPI